MLVDFRKIDGWVSWRVLFGVLFRVMVWAHFCSIDGRVLLGAFFEGVLLEVLACKHCYLGSMLVHFVAENITQHVHEIHLHNVNDGNVEANSYIGLHICIYIYMYTHYIYICINIMHIYIYTYTAAKAYFLFLARSHGVLFAGLLMLLPPLDSTKPVPPQHVATQDTFGVNIAVRGSVRKLVF